MKATTETTYMTFANGTIILHGNVKMYGNATLPVSHGRNELLWQKQ